MDEKNKNINPEPFSSGVNDGLNSTGSFESTASSGLSAPPGISGIPEKPPTTHFHNFFYDTFTWKYPRTTGLFFLGSLVFLLLGHYVNILRYVFKGAYITFAVTAAFEFLGRPTTGTGFMTQVRPKRYYIIPRENMDNIFAEIHDFLNFVVLETQRILFVEKLTTTVGAFVLSYLGYVLIKYLPIWGLTLLADVMIFTFPLIYIQNQEVIDHHVHQASSVVSERVVHAKNLAEKHTTEYTLKAKELATDISGKVTNTYQGRQRIPSVQENKPLVGVDTPTSG